MKFLKQIFGLNGRLDRIGYLLLGVLPMIGLMFLLNFSYHSQVVTIILLIVIIPILILTPISAVKRGRDSGLNGLFTLFLFGTLPVLIMVLGLQFRIDISYMAFIFIAYLLLMPSSSKEVKVVDKVEYVFTLMAIVIVLPYLILGLAPMHSCRENEAKISIICTQMSGIANTLDIFKLDNGVYPTTDEGLSALISNPNMLKYPNYQDTPYYKKLPRDTWGHPIIYVKTKDGFELVSYAADRKEGGEDEGADILYSECERR